MSELSSLFFLLMVIVGLLTAAIRRNNLAGMSVVRVCITAMLIAIVGGPAVGGVFWLLDRYVVHAYLDSYSTWPEIIFAWRMYATLGTIAGSVIGLMWGLITVLASLGRRRP
ncbi:MAG: hypothetical protein K8T25_21095 [Planctomycetia bacterium]|nr:hypothetical protein [Planctomycetia bacterium]